MQRIFGKIEERDTALLLPFIVDREEFVLQTRVNHCFDPLFDCDSQVLILGTIPSPKSREVGFYYSHPQNKFWRVISDVLSSETPVSIQDKKNLLLEKKVALWDVLESCEIKGADDNSIKNPIANDLKIIRNVADIRAIFTTGKKATMLYNKYCKDLTGMQTIYLPSTSPANCRFYTYEDLVQQYRIILEYMEL